MQLQEWYSFLMTDVMEYDAHDALKLEWNINYLYLLITLIY